MTDATFEVTRSLSHVITTFIEAATKLAVALAERRAQRLREAAIAGERVARAERARLAAHHAADAAIWRRTADPAWWRQATPELLASAWRAASTWQHADPEAAGARQAIADRLAQRGVDITAQHHVDPGDARWLSAALALANAEREEHAARSADTDQLGATERLGKADEHRSRTGHASPPDQPAASAGGPGDSAALQKTVPAPPGFRPTANPATPAPHAADIGQPAVSQRMQALLREAWAAHKVDRVLADPAWPMLANTLNLLQQKGIDVPKLLGELPYDTTIAKVPAALTAWTLRAAAAGPVHLRAAQRQHNRRLQRLPHETTPAAPTSVPAQQVSPAAADKLDPATQDRASPPIHIGYPTTAGQSLRRHRSDPVADTTQHTVPEHLDEPITAVEASR